MNFLASDLDAAVNSTRMWACTRKEARPMDSSQALTFVALGALLGAAGQGVRAVVGIKKEIDHARSAGKTVSDWFDGKELSLSFVLGAIAGILAAISQYAPDVQVSRNLLFGLAAAGYSGADFIDGIIQKWLPAKTQIG